MTDTEQMLTLIRLAKDCALRCADYPRAAVLAGLVDEHRCASCGQATPRPHVPSEWTTGNEAAT